MTLYRMALRQIFVSWLVWAIVIVLGVATVVSAAPAVAHSDVLAGLVQRLPSLVRGLLGGPLLLKRPVDGYLYVKLVMYLPLLVGIFTGFQASSLLARDRDHRRLDFLLSLPVTRRRLLLVRLGALVTAQAAMWAVVILALCGFMHQEGLQVDTAGYVLVGYSGFLVTLATGSIALWASAGARDYGAALRWGLGAAAVPFVYDLSVRIATTAHGWLYILPYGYYDPPQLLLTHAFPWLATAVLVVASGLLTYAAVHTFEQREV